MILELDCGNSFIKWRVLHADATHLVAEGVVDGPGPAGRSARMRGWISSTVAWSVCAPTMKRPRW